MKTKVYPTAFNGIHKHSIIVPLKPPGRQAFVFDPDEQKWFMVTSDGKQWVREIPEEETKSPN